jgi:hypothetical protein
MTTMGWLKKEVAVIVEALMLPQVVQLSHIPRLITIIITTIITTIMVKAITTVITTIRAIKETFSHSSNRIINYLVGCNHKAATKRAIIITKVIQIIKMVVMTLHTITAIVTTIWDITITI